MPPTMTG